MIKALISEYGIAWLTYRVGYELKLRLMRVLPFSEKLFEHKVDIKRIDIFSPDTVAISQFLHSLPEREQNELIGEADEAIKGVLSGFSSIKLDYGYPLNWHLNPLTGVTESSMKKWYKIPDFDEARGDIKAIWEASRFTHFLTLARAYLLTQDVKYYDSFSFQLADWLEKNPYSYGANFKCGQECALRMMNTLLAYSVFCSQGITTSQDQAHVIELVKRCYKKILSNFYYAHRCIKNNHTLSEIVGMIIGAWCSNDQRKIRKAFRLLDQEIEDQFFEDGGYKQYSFNYQRFALQLMECIQSVSKQMGVGLSESSRSRILASAYLMYQCMDEGGDLPNYGANDGALIFPVTSCGYRDFRPVIQTTFAQNSDSDSIPYGMWSEEKLWFGVSEKKLSAVPRGSSAFPDAGIFTLVNDDLFIMACANNFSSRPGHMHQLHLDIWYRNRNIFCDAGSYSYADKLGKRLGGTASHNTVKVKDKEQMNRFSNFLVFDWSARKEFTHTDELFVATIKSKNGYEHRREVSLNGLRLNIKDYVIGAEEYSIHFHTPFMVQSLPGQITIFDGEIELCRIITDCEVALNNSYRSLYYLRKEKTTQIEIKAKSKNTEIEILFKE